MSVTPDFIGQVYKDTNTGNIWRANSLTPGDWTLEVQNLNLHWSDTSANLMNQIPVIVVENAAGLQTLTSDAANNPYAIDIENQAALTSVSFPNLVNVDQFGTWLLGVFISGASITSILFPSLQVVGGDFRVVTSGVTTLNISSLQSLAGKLQITSTALTTISAPSLTTVGDKIFAISNASLTSMDLSSLVTSPSGLNIATNASLVSINLSAYVPDNGADQNCSANALNQATVDLILARCVANAGFVSGNVFLNAGTNSTPSAAGLADKATLIGRGVTVTTN